MSEVTDRTAKIQADLDATSADLDTLAAGVKALDDIIIAFQNSPGTLSPADQAALDDIVTRSAALRAKAESISTAPPAPVA